MSERFLRLPAVKDRIGLGRTVIYEMIGRGEFPKPVPISAGAVAWRESEIDDWQRARIAARDKAA